MAKGSCVSCSSFELINPILNFSPIAVIIFILYTIAGAKVSWLKLNINQKKLNVFIDTKNGDTLKVGCSS